MKVKEAMTPSVQTCTAETDLATAARTMKVYQCGVLPVFDHLGRGTVIGIITDRDVAMALRHQTRPASDMLVWEVATHGVHVCAPDDDIGAALTMMETYQIRRLPVVSDAGRLQGMISLDDLAGVAGSKGSPLSSQIMRTLKAISVHRPTVGPRGTRRG